MKFLLKNATKKNAFSELIVKRIMGPKLVIMLVVGRVEPCHQMNIFAQSIHRFAEAIFKDISTELAVKVTLNTSNSLNTLIPIHLVHL